MWSVFKKCLWKENYLREMCKSKTSTGFGIWIISLNAVPYFKDVMQRAVEQIAVILKWANKFQSPICKSFFHLNL